LFAIRDVGIATKYAVSWKLHSEHSDPYEGKERGYSETVRVIDKYDDVWNWKRGPLTIFGPFRSEEEAEEWMGQKGAFEEP